MKITNIMEAKHLGSQGVLVEEWQDDGQVLYLLTRSDVQKLKRLAVMEVEAEPGQSYNDAEAEIIDQIAEILDDSKRVTAEFVWDWYNFELKRKNYT